LTDNQINTLLKQNHIATIDVIVRASDFKYAVMHDPRPEVQNRALIEYCDLVANYGFMQLEDGIKK